MACGWVRKLLYFDLQVEKVIKDPFYCLKRRELLKVSHDIFNHTGLRKIRYLRSFTHTHILLP